MKKQAIVLLVLISILFVRSSGLFAAGGDMGGAGRDGSVDRPFLIEDFNDFQAFCGDANYWAEGVCTELECDLDLDPNLPGREIYRQAPIAGDPISGDPSYYPFDGIAFMGSFEGNEHVISNLTIDGAEYCGLFGCIGNTVYSPGSNYPISNLGLENVSITGTSCYVGGLVGLRCSFVRLTNCYSTGRVVGGDGVGGLVGTDYCDTDMMNCYSTCSVTGRGWVGGLIGSIGSGGSIVDSYATGEVNGRRTVGGFVGSNNGGSIVNCYSRGDVNCLGQEVGGIAGRNSGKASVTSSYSTGEVTGVQYVGGIVGWNEGSVMLSYSAGAITAPSGLVGGIVGENRGSVGSSCSTGLITGMDGYAGGIVGRGCYVDNVTSCFWDVETCGVDVSAGGTGKTTAEMKDIDTFIDAGWDFVGERSNGTSEIWQMSAVSGYPVLSFSSGYVPVALAGEGSEDDPYLIGNAEELGAVYHYNNNACFKLVSDIDLNDIEWSTAVMPVFGGCFDGNDCVIYNLNIEGGGYLGLIGIAVNAAEVNNVALKNVSVAGTGSHVGGLVGYACYGYVTNSYSTGAVTGKTRVGGLVGYHEGLVESSYSMCAIIGSVSGGLVGENEGHVINSYSTGDVTGGGSGGLVGCNYNKVANSYSTGAVTGDSSVGGLVGVNHARVMSSYSTSVVTGNRYVGGLVGYNYDGISGSVTSSFWDVESSGIGVSGDDNVGATGKTTAEMQTVRTFLDAGWDLVTVWNIEDGQTYPLLRKYSAFDSNYDGKVNFIDFAEFANRWLESE